MAKRITCLGAITIARWLLALIAVSLAAELCAGQSPTVSKSHWEAQLRRAQVLRDAPSQPPQTARLLADVADGRLGSHRLIAAALVASGVEDAGLLGAYQRRFDAWRDELRRSGRLRGDNRQRAQAIHDYLHAQVLHGGYRDDATDLGHVFETGEYNCVSSAVCFLALAQELGISANAVELPGHCLIELPTAGGVVEVETTCPQWFEVLDSPDRRREMVRRVTGFEHRSEQQRRPINDVQLLGIIYYNRGVEQLARHEYRASAESNLLAIEIDPTNQIAHGNLLATLNNWALDINAAGRYGEALDLLETAVALAPQHRNFLSNEIHITQNWVDALLAVGDWPAALELVDRMSERRVREPYYRKARWSIVERQAEAYLAAGNSDRVLNLFDVLGDRYPGDTEPERIEVGVWNRAALRHLDGGNYSAALTLLDFALQRLPQAATLQNNRSAIISRWSREALARDDFATARQRAFYGAESAAQLPDSQRQLWRYCCEQELAAALRAGRPSTATHLLAEAARHDPDNPRWQAWKNQLGAAH